MNSNHLEAAAHDVTQSAPAPGPIVTAATVAFVIALSLLDDVVPPAGFTMHS